MGNRGQISRLLKECLVYRHQGGIEAVAKRLDDTYDYVWSQTHERVNPHIKVIRAAFLETKDPRLKKILEPEGWELIPKRKACGKLRGMEDEAVDVVIKASILIQQVRETVKDGMITTDEAADLRRFLNDLETEVVEVRATIEKAEAAGNVRPLRKTS